MPPNVPPPRIRYISACLMIGMRELMDVKSTLKNIDEIKPATQATVHISASKIPTTRPVTNMPSSGETKKKHAALIIKLALGFIFLKP